MSRRKLHFRKQRDKATANLPGQHVVGKGVRKFGKDLSTEKVAGSKVSAPTTQRKRELVDKWTRDFLPSKY